MFQLIERWNIRISFAFMFAYFKSLHSLFNLFSVFEFVNINVTAFISVQTVN